MLKRVASLISAALLVCWATSVVAAAFLEPAGLRAGRVRSRPAGSLSGVGPASRSGTVSSFPRTAFRAADRGYASGAGEQTQSLCSAVCRWQLRRCVPESHAESSTSALKSAGRKQFTNSPWRQK